MSIEEKKQKWQKPMVFTLLYILQCVVGVITFHALSVGNLSATDIWVLEHPGYFIYSTVLVAWLLWLFYACFHDLRWSYLVVQLILTVFGVAEYIKYGQRKEYIEFADFLISGEWGDATSDIHFSNWKIVVFTVVATLVVSVVCWMTKSIWKSKRTSKKIVLELVSILVLLATMAGIIIYPAVKNGISRYVVLGAEGEKKGGLVCFVESFGYYFYNTHNNDIYDVALKDFEEDEAAKEQGLQLATKETVEDIAVKPNIIVIMSEALWDINQISEVATFSENPMAEFDAIQSEFTGGSVNANIFGGGTDKSEFEFLTGWNSKYLIERSAYRSFFNETQPSMVEYLNALGYNSYAIHPYKPNFWNRDVAYMNMGFQDFYDWDKMQNQEKYDVFISDDALTQEIIDRYEERRTFTDAPVFSFSTSIANHVIKIVDGPKAPINTDISVNYNIDYWNVENIDRKQLTEYVNGVSVSGKAFKRLVEYFENVDEPTVILLFGDHAPSFLSGFEEYLPEKTVKEAFYHTPFIVWNNYGLGDFGVEECNIAYLQEALMEYIGFPLTKQNVLNRYLRLQSPIDTRFVNKYADGSQIDITNQEFVDQCYGVYSAMYYYLKRAEENPDIWSVQE